MSTQLGKLSVGSTVFLNIEGGKRDFIIVNQGLPSSDYDDSCNGTWLLMKEIYEQREWNDVLSTLNSYSKSTIHNYLNIKFLELLDPDIQDVIKLVKIPYANGSSGTGSIAPGSMTSSTTSGSIASGSNGLMTKIFLLSLAETGINHSNVTAEGSILEYFTPSDYDARIGYYKGKECAWWLRSISTRPNTAAYIDTLGDVSQTAVNNNIGIRPAMILPSALIVDDDGFVTPVSASMDVQGSVTIDGVQKHLTGKSYVNINGVWKPIVKSYTCIGSVWKVI